jgi:hypothetical protein
MKKNQLLHLFFTLLTICFLSTESKAVCAFKSAPKDTCVTIKMKDGNEISAVIVEKTAQKVRFRKCGSEVTDTVFFVPMSKIESIYSPKSDYAIDTDTKINNKSKLQRIKNLVISTYASNFLLIAISLSQSGIANLGGSVLVLLLLLFGGITAILALIELINYKGRFEGKDLLIGLMTLKSIIFLLSIIIFLAFVFAFL